MKSFYKYLLLIFLILQTVVSHGIGHMDEDDDDHDHEHEHEHEEEDEKEYGIHVTIIGIIAVLICSFLGTVLPVLLKKKSFFKEDTILFGSVKLFGTGVILGVAFIHMLSPANELLTSKYTYALFNEKYTSFSGIFAIAGILITHLIQVYASHFLEDVHGHDHIHVHNTSDCKGLKHEKSDIIKLEEGDITKCESISSDETKRENVSESKEWHERNNKVSLVPAVDDCAANQHEILHLLERKEKQIVCYLLEIGISLHSVLIGVAFGLESHGLIVLMIALMFHQFFEGVSLSSVFIEAHFKRISATLLMIILYSCTMPLGGVIGLILRSSLEPTSKVYITLQGIIDSIAAGILIYDILVNILARHCTSCNWKKTRFIGKNIQLFSFYLGLFIIAIIGIWA